MVEIPSFPECKHPIVVGLARHTDQELLTLFQRKSESGQYFLAIFCRYSPIIYTLIQHSARSPVQANYLFSMTWRHIYHELRGVELRQFLAGPSTAATDPSTNRSSTNRPSNGVVSPSLTLQNWLINITAVCINKAKVPPTESIHYSMDKASPPLWCYLEQALNRLPSTHRLVLLLEQTFHWSKPRIAAYLQAEGEPVSAKQLDTLLDEGYSQLREALPEDIQTIYLNELRDQATVDSTIIP